MAVKMFDVDAIQPPDLQITMGGKQYLIPGAVNVDKALEIFGVTEELQKGNGSMVDSANKQWAILVELFQPKYPEVTVERIKKELTWQQGSGLLRFIQSEILQIGEDKKENPS